MSYYLVTAVSFPVVRCSPSLETLGLMVLLNNFLQLLVVGTMLQSICMLFNFLISLALLQRVNHNTFIFVVFLTLLSDNKHKKLFGMLFCSFKFKKGKHFLVLLIYLIFLLCFPNLTFFSSHFLYRQHVTRQ